MVIETLLKVAPEVQVATLDPSTNFRDQLDFDSLDFLNFALALEKRFGLKIPEGEYPRLSSLDGFKTLFPWAFLSVQEGEP